MCSCSCRRVVLLLLLLLVMVLLLLQADATILICDLELLVFVAKLVGLSWAAVLLRDCCATDAVAAASIHSSAANHSIYTTAESLQ